MRAKEIEILFEDDDLIAVDKPAGLEVLCDIKHKIYEHRNLKKIVSKEINRDIFPIHKIDRDASGIVIFAKSQKGLELLRSRFSDNSLKIKFLLLLSGLIDEQFLNEEKNGGLIDFPILVKDDRAYISDKGRNAQTKYKIEEVFRGYTFVEASPQTHMKHQMRAHFAKLGNPLAIDPVYSSSEPIMLSSFKRKYNLPKGQEERPLIKRLTMHCAEINFLSANSKEQKIKSNLPRDFEVTLKQMKKYCRL
jgi:23S rRNA-/tRNA-specific pseudouridylate synthase